MAGTSPQPNVTAHGRVFIYPPIFWLLVLLGGAGSGLAGGLLMRLLRIIEHLAYGYTSGDFLSGVAASAASRRVTMLFFAGIIAGVAGYALSKVYGSKRVGLNTAIWFRSGRLPFVYTVLNGLLSIVIVGMGMSLGREGALKDTGGAIASKLSDWLKIPTDQRRLLVACCAGAGMAAAYNIPMGGALFAVEVLLGTLSFSTVLPALAASMIATAVSWLLLPNQPTYIVPPYVLQLPDLLWAILAAPVFGLASVFWVRAIGWAESLKPKGWHKIAAPIVVLTVIGFLSIRFPDILGNGKGLVQRSYANQLDLKLLATLLVLRFFATTACLGTGAPGGVFTPTMTYGALLGGSLGRLWAFVLPGSDVGVFAAIGSASVLAVTTQGPISSIVMVMELTHHIDAIMVPVLIATVGASLTAHWMEPQSVYSAPLTMGAGELQLPPMELYAASATLDYQVLSSATPYALVAQRILHSGDVCFVVNERLELIGQLSRSALASDSLLQPLDAMTASDLALPVEPICSDANQSQVRDRLNRSRGQCLPVIDAQTKVLLGAVANRQAIDP